MTNDNIRTLVNAYELLRGAQLAGLTGEQTVLAGQTILAFRDLLQDLINETSTEEQGGDENESQD